MPVYGTRTHRQAATVRNATIAKIEVDPRPSPSRSTACTPTPPAKTLSLGQLHSSAERCSRQGGRLHVPTRGRLPIVPAAAALRVRATDARAAVSKVGARAPARPPRQLPSGACTTSSRDRDARDAEERPARRLGALRGVRRQEEATALRAAAGAARAARRANGARLTERARPPQEVERRAHAVPSGRLRSDQGRASRRRTTPWCAPATATTTTLPGRSAAALLRRASTARRRYSIKLEPDHLDGTFFNTTGLPTNEQGFNILFARPHVYGNITKHLSTTRLACRGFSALQPARRLLRLARLQALTLRFGKGLIRRSYEHYASIRRSSP